MRTARVLVPVLASTTLLLGLPLTPAGAAAPSDPDVASVAAGLVTLTVVLDELGTAPELATRVPLTERSLGDVLGLPGALSSTLATGLAGPFSSGAGLDSFSALEDLVEAASGSGVEFDVEVGDADDSGRRALQVDVQVTRDDAVLPFAYGRLGDPEATPPVPDLLVRGGPEDGVVADVSLRTSLALSFDPTVRAADGTLDQQRALTLAGGAEVDVTAVTGDEQAMSFRSRYGFGEVDVEGEGVLDLAAAAAFVDPDGQGGITRGEWESTLPVDLLQVDSVERDGEDVDISVGLDNPLVDGDEDGSLSFVGDSDAYVVEDGETGDPAAPEVETSEDLEGFARITPDDALTALSQFATVLQGAQSTIDLPLPLLEKRFSAAYDPAGALFDVVERQGSAAVVCGKANTVPPTGEELAGTTWYCQALTREAPESVTWSVAGEGAEVSANGSSTATVGVAPTANVTLTGVTGEPDVTVEWTTAAVDDGDAPTHSAGRRIRSAQDLREALDVLPGPDVELDYDDATTALTYRVRAETDPAAVESGFDLTDLLRPEANLTGLETTDTASVDIGTVSLDSTFGMLLTADLAGIDGSASEVGDADSPGDRYVYVDGDADDLQVADGSIAYGSPQLTGRIGSLGVDASGSGFSFSSPDADAPLLTTDVSPSDLEGAVREPGGVAGAALLRDVLNDLGGSVEATYDMAAEASLDVVPSAPLQAILPEGGDGTNTVEVSWPDVGPGTAPAVTVGDDYATYLKLFDVTPTREGTHSGGEAADQLVDERRDFRTDFGFTVGAGDGAIVPGTLYNVTTGASCSSFRVVDDSTLECANGGLSGGHRGERDADGAFVPDATWAPGDRWEVRGDLDAMRTVVVETLVKLATQIEASEDPAHDGPLPLIGLSPKQMSPQFSALRDVAAELVVPAAPAVDPAAPAGTTPAEPAAPTLQLLRDQLESALDGLEGYEDATVAFEVADQAPVGGGDAVPHLLVDVSLPAEGTTEAPVRIGLASKNLPPLVRAELAEGGAAVLPVDWASTGRVAFGVPIDLGVPVSDVTVSSETGVSELTATAGSETVEFTGSLGSIGLRAGAGATMEGSHTGPTGAATVPTPPAGTVPAAFTGTVTASASGVHTVKGLSPLLSRGPLSLTNTSKGFTCIATSSGSGFTCPAPAGKTWDVRDAVSLDPGAALRGTGLAAKAPVGARVVRADGGACTVTAKLGADAVRCDVTGGWVTGQAFSVFSTTVLTDGGRAAADAVPFTDLVPAAPVGATVHNTTRPASCTITGRTATTVTCASPLKAPDGAAGEWRDGDAYRVDLPSTTVLVDPGKGFDDMDLVGATLQNVTDAADCVVTATTAHTVSCAGLSKSGQWTPGDAYRLGGDAEAGFSLTGYTYAGATDGPLEGYVGTMSGSPLGAAPVDCGSQLVADACARLSLAADDGSYLGTLRYEADLDSDSDDANGVTLPKALTDAAAGEEGLEWSLLHAAVGQLKRYVSDGLDGTLADEPLPMIGLDYTAGARLLDALDELEVKLTAVSPPEFTEGKTTGAWEDELEKLLNDQLKTLDASLASLVGTASVTLYCDATSTTPCNRTLTDGTQINDLRVDFAIGQNLDSSGAAPGAGCANCGGTTHALEFDPGLEDLPVRLTGAALEAKAAWRFAVSFGLDRANGPYLAENPTQDGPELQLGARVRLPDATTPCSVPRPDAFSGFSADRCVAATLGLFQGVVYDGDGTSGDLASGADRSQVDLTTTVDVGSSDTNDDGKVGALDQLDGLSAAATVEVDARANVDLAFLTGVSPGGDIPASALPSIRGQVHLGFDSRATAAASTVYNLDGTSEVADAVGVEHWTDVSYDNLAIDPGSFVNDFVKPIADEIVKYTRPLKPIIDMLRAPIPVLSDLARLTGQSIGTLRQILENSGARLALIDALTDAMDFAERASQTVAENTWVGLGVSDGTNNSDGTFITKPKDKRTGSCGKTDAAGVKQAKDCKSSTKRGGTTTKTSVKQTSPCPATGCTGKEMTRTMTRTVNKPKLVGTGVAFPFLNDSGQVFGMLLGESDAVLVRFDAGTLGASGGMGASFGPFMAGPVPIDISIGVQLSINARFAMGYDTRGILNTLRQEPDEFNPDALLDGIFIDDNDLFGTDVPEIRVAVTATLGASLSVAVFKVGLEGGVTIAIDFNLHDSDQDGRIRIEEIKAYGDNPQCLFDIRGTLGFFLQFFVEVDLKLWSKRWNVTLFELRPPLTMFEVECERPDPALARTTGGNLELLMGSPELRALRYYETAKEKEKFLVRPLPLRGDQTWVSVEAFGLYLEYQVPTGGRIVADGGSGNDTITVEAGVADDGSPIELTVPVTFSGGPGSDTLVSRGGDDVLAGGEGADSLNSGEGDDVLDGGPGNDGVTGGLGDDVLTGGADDDSVSGDAGADLVRGGEGNDTVTGGPGLDERSAAKVQDAAGKGLLDEADVVVGDGGDDSLQGHAGDDWLFGDALTGVVGTPTERDLLSSFSAAPSSALSSETACADASTTGGRDKVDGERGDDVVVGGAGNDDLLGALGADVVCGNEGADVVEGDSSLSTVGGDDVLVGGAGPDRLFGRDGTDRLVGGDGDDLLDAGDGDDVAIGGAGADAVAAGNGADTVLGDAGDVDGAGAVTFTASGGSVDAAAAPCRESAVVRGGSLDLDGDGVPGDDGQFAGVAVVDGRLDLDADGDVDAEDNGVLAGSAVTAGVLQAADVSVEGLARTGTALGNGDCVVGGGGPDTVYGQEDGDTVLGGVGRDTVDGGDGKDLLRGYQDDDVLTGGAGDDLLYGDSGKDVLRGGADSDQLLGGAGTDTAFGEGGDDTLLGDGDADRLVGGSDVAGAADGRDVLEGGTGADALAGDNAEPAGGPAPALPLQLLDLPVPGSAPPGAADVLRGGKGDDVLHGQAGDDELEGQEDRDRLEGGAGDDTARGGPGDDLVVGGSGVHADALGRQKGLPGMLDGADELHGDGGNDRVAGDNALLTPTGVTLYDVDRVTGAAPPGGTSAGDALHGGVGDDLLVGQGGDDDAFGDAGLDEVYGSSGADELQGGPDADVLVGGSREAGVRDDGAGDDLLGGGGGDLLAGDNAAPRGVAGLGLTLLDVPFVSAVGLPPAGTAGPDRLAGEGDADRLYGQAGDDSLSGGDGDDAVEGGPGSDELAGDSGRDALFGGSSDDQSGAGKRRSLLDVADAGDELRGGDGEDLLLGDNGHVWRNADGAVRWHLGNTAFAGATAPAAALAGDDLLEGGADTDRLFGQGGGDALRGQSHDDHLEGGAGTDDVEGGAGADDALGGSSRDWVAFTERRRVLQGAVDGADAVRGDGVTASGDDQSDVLLGDNGVIDRTGDDPNTGDAVRTVGLHDVPVIGSPAPSDATRGDDTVTGDGDSDQLYGQGGDDVLSGGDGDDHAEGGPGDDDVTGGPGHDDLLGGSSSTVDGAVRRTGKPARLATGVADGSDTLDGGTGEDVLSGDNATVVRPVDRAGVWLRHANPFGHPRRTVGVNAVDPAGAFGNDRLRGAGGSDELHGQLGDDVLEGADGDDVLVGDLAAVTPTVLAGPARQLEAGGFVVDRVDVPGSLRRDVELLDHTQGGADQLVGGLGNDALHGGAAADRMNGEGTLVGPGDPAAAAKLSALDASCALDRRACDLDALFGGDGDDSMWGGPQRDHLYGGHGDDRLDVIAGGGNPLTDFKGSDVLFGGWGRDALQADVSRPSPNGEDKLIDTTGAYNAYYVCESAYGGNSILRLISPAMLTFVQELAVSDGAPRAAQTGTSGFRELAMVYSGDMKDNSGKPYPGGLGSGTCT